MRSASTATPPLPARPFITLEGVDGCGKSTQARLLVAALEASGYEVLALREPGGTVISEKIRALVLDPAHTEMGDACELLLYEASRAQLVHERIAPALAAGQVVVCDRFYDSTTCYQSFAAGLDRRDVERANALAVGAFHPLVTLVFDLDPAQAAPRAAARDAAPDRMEAKGLAYQELVARGFRAIAAEDPERVRLIDASGAVPVVFKQVVAEMRAAGFALTDDAVACACAGPA